ncbi:chorismate pyruvate-lyase family protein [Myxosarcina sp. GI1]|uniref:chorismate--pyruvate lyase family protein n=1 Tax=Myxosarcina sp. GI1 TaxID=1541065 RepID=UPI00055C7D26|nr:chorismate pyruvate-lyase family protein [Myxosarcina sp. GI1]
MQAQTINELTNPNSMMRQDLEKSLLRSHINPANLSTFQRIILTTNGTLTEILEAYLYEKIGMVKLSEALVAVTQDIPLLEVKRGTEVIERKILLQGKISRKNFIYAESILVTDRLEEKFKNELLHSSTPLGRLWLEYKLETFKEIVDTAEETAEKLATYFPIKPEDKILSRTYRVFSQRKPIMTITEKFPASYFLSNF